MSATYIHLKSLIEAELDCFVESGVLEPIATAKHAAYPIVPVLKKTESDLILRVCGDYKVGINEHVDIQHYPLPSVDELLVQLAGNQRFSKVDLADAYLQVELDEDARDYRVINTHHGLFRYRH